LDYLYFGLSRRSAPYGREVRSSAMNRATFLPLPSLTDFVGGPKEFLSPQEKKKKIFFLQLANRLSVLSSLSTRAHCEFPRRNNEPIFGGNLC